MKRSASQTSVASNLSKKSAVSTASKTVATSNSLLTAEEKQAIATLAGVQKHTKDLKSHMSVKRKAVYDKVKALKISLGAHMESKNATCLYFENEEGDPRYLRKVIVSAPLPVKPEKVSDAMSILDKEHIKEAHSKLKQKEPEKAKRFANVLEEAMELVLRQVVFHTRTDIDVKESKERLAKGQETPKLDAAWLARAIEFEKLKLELSSYKDESAEEVKIQKTLNEKQAEVLPVIKAFLEKHSDIESHKIDLTSTADEKREALYLREKVVTPPLKWFTVKSAKPIVCECIEKLVPLTVEYNDHNVDEFLKNKQGRTVLVSSISDQLAKKREEMRKLPTKVIKLEKAAKSSAPRTKKEKGKVQKVDNDSDDSGYESGNSGSYYSDWVEWEVLIDWLQIKEFIF